MKTKDLSREELMKMVRNYKKTLSKLVNELTFVEEGLALEYDARIDSIARKLTDINSLMHPAKKN